MQDRIDPETVGIVMAIVISFFRVVYDKKETSISRIFMESWICGCLTFTATAAISALSLDPDWAIVAGGMIGYLGSMTVRSFVIKFLNKQVGK